MRDKQYQLRCYIDGKRALSHKLSRKDAKIFLKTARHLCKYLKAQYKL